MKLQKLPLTLNNPSLESAYLAEKYGAPSPSQRPLMGAGGAGPEGAVTDRKPGAACETEGLCGEAGVPDHVGLRAG